MIDDVLREYYDIPKSQKVHVSARFYKGNSEISFCVLFVVGHTSRVIECIGTKCQTPKVIKCLHIEDTGIYSYPQIIRDWTGRNIVWKFERSDYYD